MSLSRLLKSGVIAALGLLAATPASAQTLTGLSQFSADSAGNASGGQNWSTHPGFAGFKLFVVRNADPSANFLPGQPGISEGLPNGHHIFFIFGAAGSSSGRSGLNLFFNGATTPAISVKGVDRINAGPTPEFSANSSTLTKGLTGNTVAASGALSTIVSGKQIVLSHFEWSTPTANFFNEGRNFNRVTPHTHENPAVPDGEESLGGNDFVGKFELDVSDETGPSVPEPASLLLFLPALGAIAALRRRH